MGPTRTGKPRTAVEGRPEHGTRRAKILIVDDCASFGDAIRHGLGQLGYEVVVLDSPLSFSHVLNREKPDLALIDVAMPALPGDRLVAVAQRHQLHRCPLVLFSGRPEEELRDLAHNCGASGYICKDIGIEALAARIADLLKAA
jgi:DNA-binding response OmpR family regulator